VFQQRDARPARGRSRGSPLADAQASRGLGPKVQPLFASELERLTNAALRATMRELQARLKVKETERCRRAPRKSRHHHQEATRQTASSLSF